MAHEHGSHNDGKAQSAAKWVFISFLLVAGYFLIMEHRAHLGGVLYYLPFLLLLACPLLHLFHHGGHGGGGHRPTDASNESTQEKK
jgi:hypothetical protein